MGWGSVAGYADHNHLQIRKSVVINDLHVFGADIRPNEADAVSVVDANAMLPLSVAAQRFQLVAGRYPEPPQQKNRVKLVKLTSRCSPRRLRAGSSGGPCIHSVEDVLCAAIPERSYHTYMITQA